MRRSNNPAQIANRRLVNEHLVNPELKTAVEVVATLGAVQAQDYGGSKWALSQRAIGLTDVAIEDDISTGRIVRTHVLRPTWHFVAAADIRWMLRLTAPRVHMANAYSYRYHELDEAVFRKSRRALTRALEDGKHLTREELAAAMKAARINIDDRQRVAHLMMNAELDGLICSGARRGKQFTYSLLDERVPAGEVFSRDEALSELAKRFFSTRGPATLDDFAWWSGLTKTDARRGALAAASAVVEEKIEGRSYYSAADERKLKRSANLAHLLPNYDEYFVGFKDRGAMVHRLRQKGLNPRTDALFGHVLTINGQVVGGWTRSLTPREVRVTLRIVDKLSRPEERAIDKAVKQFAGFLGRQARVV